MDQDRVLEEARTSLATTGRRLADLVASAPDPDNLGSVLRGGTASAGRQPAAAGPATQGCPFSPRCPLADDRCRTDDPPPMRVSAVRAAACWRLDVAAPGILAQSQGGGT